MQCALDELSIQAAKTLPTPEFSAHRILLLPTAGRAHCRKRLNGHRNLHGGTRIVRATPFKRFCRQSSLRATMRHEAAKRRRLPRRFFVT